MANPGLDECTICFLIASRCQDRRSPGDLVAHRKDVDPCADYAHSPPNSSSQTWLLPPDVDAVVLHCIQRQQSRLHPRHAEAQDAPRQRLQQETRAAFASPNADSLSRRLGRAVFTKGRGKQVRSQVGCCEANPGFDECLVHRFHPFCRRPVSISQSSWTQPRSYWRPSVDDPLPRTLNPAPTEAKKAFSSRPTHNAGVSGSEHDPAQRHGHPVLVPLNTDVVRELTSQGLCAPNSSAFKGGPE